MLVQRGHTVTLFNRGVTETANRSDVEIIHGDRAHDLNRLPSRAWDGVIDTCGYTPKSVASSAQHLHDAGRYLFISSISVYDAEAAANGELPLATLPADANPEQVTPETYGALKALCEDRVRQIFAERTTVVRPGLIAGPYDPTDRFTYWPVRVGSGGRFLAPESPEHGLQYIDVRDAAEFAVTLLENDRGGIYDAVTAPASRTFGALIGACIDASNANAQPAWASAEFLRERKVQPWSDLPLWIPRSDPSYRLMTISNARALAAGLTLRELPETVRATWTWAKAAGKAANALAAGLAPEREAEILAALAA